MTTKTSTLQAVILYVVCVALSHICLAEEGDKPKPFKLDWQTVIGMPITCLETCDNGALIAGTDNGELYFISASGKLQKRVRGHTRVVSDVVEAQGRALSVSREGSVCIIDSDRQVVLKHVNLRFRIDCAALSDDGAVCAVNDGSSRSPSVAVLDPRTADVLYRMGKLDLADGQAKRFVQHLDLGKHGTNLLVGTNREVILVDMHERRTVSTFDPRYAGRMPVCGLDSNCETFAVWHRHFEVREFNERHSRSISSLRDFDSEGLLKGYNASACRYSSKSNSVAIVMNRSVKDDAYLLCVRLDVSPLKSDVFQVTQRFPLSEVVWSADGESIYTSAEDGSIARWVRKD